MAIFQVHILWILLKKLVTFWQLILNTKYQKDKRVSSTDSVISAIRYRQQFQKGNNLEWTHPNFWSLIIKKNGWRRTAMPTIRYIKNRPHCLAPRHLAANNVEVEVKKIVNRLSASYSRHTPVNSLSVFHWGLLNPKLPLRGQNGETMDRNRL